ncbi:LamG-like jellyroll fold domain-containing protein [Actinoplanes sp. NPDC048791]|uniref:LamG-like jellyroll fold domain-containing protein n=1 Tax=Actinoplanes sp. NPDC048791 TaxID=3154623 RepID=UPI0033DF1657
MRSRSLVVPAVLAGLLAGSVPDAASAHEQVGTPSATVAAARTAADAAKASRAATGGTLVARYGFDGGRATSITDESGNGHTLRLITGNGGTVSMVRRGQGHALRFPGKCTGKKRCPHAALQSPSAANLNPGTRAISYGAKVLLSRSQTSKGQNVVQKGYSATSSQYKLQVDGAAGRASCVLVGARPGIKLVTSTVSVADGTWHAVECRRTATALTVLVDGAVRGNRAIAAGLSVANDRPLSIGGKGAYSDNDQFQGTLDDVWVRIG